MPVANRLYLAHAYCGSDRCTCARACSREKKREESISYPASARVIAILVTPRQTYVFDESFHLFDYVEEAFFSILKRGETLPPVNDFLDHRFSKVCVARALKRD